MNALCLVFSFSMLHVFHHSNIDPLQTLTDIVHTHALVCSINIRPRMFVSQLPVNVFVKLHTENVGLQILTLNLRF